MAAPRRGAPGLKMATPGTPVTVTVTYSKRQSGGAGQPSPCPLRLVPGEAAQAWRRPLPFPRVRGPFPRLRPAASRPELPVVSSPSLAGPVLRLLVPGSVRSTDPHGGESRAGHVPFGLPMCWTRGAHLLGCTSGARALPAPLGHAGAPHLAVLPMWGQPPCAILWQSSSLTCSFLQVAPWHWWSAVGSPDTTGGSTLSRWLGQAGSRSWGKEVEPER